MGAVIGLLLAAGVLLALSAGRGAAGMRGRIDRRVERRRAAAAAGIGVAVGVGAWLATGLPVVGALAAGFGICVPHLAQQRRARRLAEARRSAWPDIIDGMAGAVRAGFSLPEAVCAVADTGPVGMRPPFAAFAAEYRRTGDFGACAERLRERLADPVGDRVLEALLTARDVGGSDLGRILRSSSDFVRNDLRYRGEAQARQSWLINGARLAVVAPWLILALLSTRPGALDAYRTATGTVILVGAATASVVAYAAMMRIGCLPEEPRVLVPARSAK